MQKLVRSLVQRRWLLLCVAAIMGAAAAVAGHGLSMDRSIESMFSPNDPILLPYQRLQRTFGLHEIVLLVYADPQFATPEGLDRLEATAERVRQTPGVVAVVTLLDPPGAADFDDDGRGARYRDVFSAYTHNEALDAGGILCLIQRPAAGETPRRETLDGLRAIAADLPSGVVVGEPVLIEEAFDLLEEDGRRLNTWCTALVLLTILACFRRLRWLLLPLAVVQLTLAATRGALVLSGMQLSMVSSMLAAIVTVVGVATVVHVMVRYEAARRQGRGRRAALEATLAQLAAPVAFACLTDAAGFASLMISEVGPVHDFGLMMAIGSLLVLPSCLLLAPGLTMIDGPAPRQDSDREPALDRRLVRLMHAAEQRRWLFAWVGLLLAAASIWGARRLQRETDFTKNFREHSSLVQAYRFVESRFGGAGVWDLMLPGDDAPNKQELVDLLQLEQRLLAIELPGQTSGLNKAISLADALDAGVGGLAELRLGAQLAIRAGVGLIRGRMPEFVDAIYNQDPVDGQTWYRVLLRSPEQLPAADKTFLIERVQQVARQQHPQAEATGYYVLLTRLIESVLADQWKTFGLAAAAIAVVMAAAFRSVPLALAVMIPNALPVLVLFGAMGWLGIHVNMGAAMIAAVSVGLSVDGSIHYVMLYQRLRRNGVACAEALARVQQTVGRAAVFATLALIVGFTTLCVSDFVPTIYFGALVSLSMLGGLIGNLVVLPMLIRAVDDRGPAFLNAAASSDAETETV